jgi:purine-nucleoside phosphorylase
MNDNTFDEIQQAAHHLNSISEPPSVAVILGSGLGAFADILLDPIKVSYGEIPFFPDVHVVGHSGQLVIGTLPDSNVRVAALVGRVHLYEGHDVARVVHPIRTLAQWGVKGALLTNAAGGINPDFNVGDLMLISDHINLSGTNPLLGPNDDRIGTRFPDMSTAYNPQFNRRIKSWADTHRLQLREGVYCGLLGPSYETPAEIRMLQAVGGDAVGMSTVCEVIAANHAGLSVAGFSCITNLAAGLGSEPLDHAEVKASADEARDRFIRLLTQSVLEFDTLLSGD